MLSRDVEKGGEEKRPLLSDLRESGNLEQAADCIVFFWRGEYADGTAIADTGLFNIAKHRNGTMAELWLVTQCAKVLFRT